MEFDYPRIWPYVIAVLAVLLVFRRLRRSFGRQPVRPIRMRVRIGILIFLACSLVPVAASSSRFLIAEFGAALAGIGLGLWGAKRTRYQTFQGQLHYIPHTYTGIAVSLLFVGRLVYRLVEIYSTDHVHRVDDATSMQGFAPPTVVQSPATVGLLCVVAGYYVCYYSLVLWKSKRISPEDIEVVPTPNAAAS
ncbi:MAG: hypothetical protein QOD56_2242 [Gammaproteobacteria bacterium]|jgi:hypothetical protein|nr:hypothetical protein [Gammaproteobacteria bacterium]